MPKKSATARVGAQRNRAKTQKSFEVIRQNDEDQEELTEDEQVEATPVSAPAPSAKVPNRANRSAVRAAARASVATQEAVTEDEVVISDLETENTPAPVAKGSASARMAARRNQKMQPRVAATLVTSEHYAYVRRDLVIIAVLATIMFIAIIVLYYTVGRGV